MNNKTLNFTILAICSLALYGCSRPEIVSISGSTTVLPAVSKAAQAYQNRHGQNIIVNAGGSGSGFNQLAEGQTDIGMMSRDITEGEIARFSQHVFTPIAIGRDAVVPVVSSEIYEAGVTQLSFAQMTDIYKGRIDNWNAVGGPDKEIFVIDKESSSGTRQTFFEIVLGDKKAEAAGADLVIGSNNEEQTAMTQSDAAIGMLSLAWLNEDVRGVSIVTDIGVIIEPTLENVANGTYPISRDLNIVVRGDISPAAQGFVDYLLSPDGQDFVQNSGYVPVNKPAHSLEQ
ncbi:MAG: phosphate ABC transporter substrate-binding protein [Litorimonas sp.]